ncbi:MAG TPA: histidine phosphatase family protein [Actinomycetota bacterium]|jgi:broad specificity phosphatase PhoE|nr:histidine phosphatase family protein [Actinomycetota bacterium]
MMERTLASPKQATDVATVYLVRHGTTTMNVENRYRGRRDIPLDAQGYQDAVDAARQLSDSGLGAVYAGGLRRTIATAQIIADEARVPDIRILHGLINVDYGAWEGMTSSEAEMFDPHAYRLYRTNPYEAVCPSGERLTDAQKRILDALTLIGERHAGEAVAAVTHAVMIRLAILSIEPVGGEEWRIPIGRGAITTLTVGADGMTLAALPTGDDVD